MKKEENIFVILIGFLFLLSHVQNSTLQSSAEPRDQNANENRRDQIFTSINQTFAKDRRKMQTENTFDDCQAIGEI